MPFLSGSEMEVLWMFPQHLTLYVTTHKLTMTDDSNNGNLEDADHTDQLNITLISFILVKGH